MDLTKTRYGFGVSWDEINGQHVDIDLQCVVVDNAGSIIDCAYYNNLKAVRAVTHSGDEASGKPDKIEEMVWVNLQKMPANVGVLVFVVAAYAGGFLRDVSNGQLHVLEEKQSNEIALFEMERSAASVDVVAAIFRDASVGWKLRIIDLPAQNGQHFMDILPLLSQVIRGFIPNAPQKQKVAFAMEKGGVLDLPMGLGQITVGLGWDVDDGEVDLDVSAVLMDAQGNDLEAVFFGRLESDEHGIKHTGDNLTGEGEGDDEQIIVELDRIGPRVQQVFFVVNIYTAGRNFMQVANPFCRIVDQASSAELCRYSLKDAGSENGLIIAKIAREAGGTRWGFHALGLPCRGRTYKDSLPEVRRVSGVKTASLMLRSATSTEFQDYSTPHAAPTGSSRAQPLPKQAKSKKKEDCSIQ
jgi:tellurium resistance protein TerZ